MKKKDTPHDAWIIHRKLRKKIASARWYAKKKKNELGIQRQRRLTLEQRWREHIRKSIWTLEQYSEWRCVCAHMFHDWPACPTNIPAMDWCKLMDLAEIAIQRMGQTVTQTWSNRKMKLCRQLVLKELCEWYRSHDGDVESVHSRMKERNWSNSHGENSSSSSSSSSAYRLCGGWFPLLCTDVGLLFLQLAVLRQVHRWPEVCRLMYQVANANRIHDVQITGDIHRHTKPPTENPMHNPCLNDPIFVQLMEMMIEIEQELEGGDPTLSTTPSTYSSLQDSLDSFLLNDLFRVDQLQDYESDQSSRTNCSDLES